MAGKAAIPMAKDTLLLRIHHSKQRVAEHLLIDKNLMSEFLECEGYRLVWTLLGGKTIRGSWKKADHYTGRTELIGYMTWRDGQLSGDATMFWNTQGSDLKEIARIDIPSRSNIEK